MHTNIPCVVITVALLLMTHQRSCLEASFCFPFQSHARSLMLQKDGERRTQGGARKERETSQGERKKGKELPGGPWDPRDGQNWDGANPAPCQKQNCPRVNPKVKQSHSLSRNRSPQQHVTYPFKTPQTPELKDP